MAEIRPWFWHELRRRNRMMREPIPAEHECGAFCRALGLEFGHTVRRTGREVAEIVGKMRRGETASGL